ncbi:MAG TPA: [FeFe] hydrogenase H-cluster radical SAM maturase HydG [Marinilabiliales bacterium]|nr:MAG: [FeFe] hydrogenase H-cluster radical SAM maturase HydG [Bacteroidetes bacterium GWA2_40_14]OFX59166.1 MAG: [FeFe] hydrogenase H-cluster radical SAM maturase HydG [Bacteroidetes bacterium GWC2_40_13]OFX73111.1 MAG: [FeFe] hydrogenase H-cluster radical SAM maturase HydG [Bacteroidetes bacterium GWD2_40_43]OFX95147.1 MAG: [FeFe] hydrogenase H-cluster radical SAM maturase HydG [Bacteroidetes bacterium GWE2_40_63]OFY19230.1 MAG: [FeFe] hydrogenase H-cluster radical SAM maturase HydG [Bactero
MIYSPEKYAIADERMKPFIDEQEIWDFINQTKPTKEWVREVIAKSLDKKRLSLEETAVLINATDPELVEEIKQGAKMLKEKVYGKRIVLFAPLYVGNYCTNNCKYCGFRTTNRKQIRTTLTEEQLIQEVEALEKNGQKRLILVYGEHPKYDAQFIADSVRTVYKVKKGNGEIRRVNINAAPLEIDDFKTVHEAGIGTYQIFQETYHRPTYASVHLAGKKANYDYRLTGLDRAQEAGIDDVGIGALFGLYDWRFEVLGLIRHVNHFEACYNVGPHTISFPRIKDASEYEIVDKYRVSDEDFTRLVAILRLAVPYTGMILTAREPMEIRREIMSFGVSQIDGGTKIEMGAYSKKEEHQDLDKEQFKINDNRSLGEIIDELLDKDYIPSFCTACYRTGRTGEHFMEFSVPGFIKNYCTPNAMMTLAEYLEDYATPEVKEKGAKVIAKNLAEMEEGKIKQNLVERLGRIKVGERDLYF